MASQGPNSAGTGANDTAVGTKAWSDPGNIVSSNNARASATSYGAWTSNYLKATNFGFSIPSGATIDGIIVEIERLEINSGNNFQDSAVKIVKSDGSIGTTNKASAAGWTTSEVYATYGSSSDLWGESWTDTDINDVDFGVVFSAVTSGGKVMQSAGVDHIRITVYYTAAGGSLIKTVDGLAIASVKTINGLAIASVKTRNGLTNV